MGREENRLVLKELNPPADGAADGGYDERIAVAFDVIGQQVRRRGQDKVVLNPGQNVILRFGRVVHRLDVKIYAGGVGQTFLVRHLIFEEGVAEEIGGRSDGDDPVIRQRHLHIQRPGDAGHRQRVAVDVAVVPEQRRRRDDERLILKRRETAVVTRHRRVVHRRDVDIDDRLGPPAFRRVRGVGELRQAVEVRVRDEADLTVRQQGGVAVHRIEDGGNDHPVAVDVI